MENEKSIFCSRCGKMIPSQWASGSHKSIRRRCPYCDEYRFVRLSKTKKNNEKKD
jgi:DNA-directed RNA polymerase subunit RPC12/RpoP